MFCPYYILYSFKFYFVKEFLKNWIARNIHILKVFYSVFLYRVFKKNTYILHMYIF